ncbi:MAG: GNAT family N-acyltransferase [Pseudomonadota bacterium]|nr:GNAT family N-acyltransferase [Pseudomonadota bacterium]
MLQEQNLTQRSVEFSQKPRIFAEFITTEQEIRCAQKMRYEVFCEEYKVELPVNMVWNGHPIDVDELDDHCLHLVVRTQHDGEIIGYTRVLTCDLAKRFGRYYSSHEFDISNVIDRPGRFLEIGRTCIHPEHRNGATIAVLWAFLAKFMQENDYQYLFGCASVSLEDGGETLAALNPVIREKYMADDEFRVSPKVPFKLRKGLQQGKANFPPLLKAYTRMGARICGEACWDPDFNVADLFVLLDINNVANRYARHFLKDREAA